MTDTVAIAVAAVGAGAGLVVALTFAIRSARQKRRIRHKLATLVTRLDSPEAGAAVEKKEMPLEAGFERLEGFVERLAMGDDRGRSDIERLIDAVEGVELGIMVVDENNDVVLVNASARDYLEGRHGKAVAQARIQSALERALRHNETTDDELEIFGPPKANLRIRARPLDDGKRSLGAVVIVEDITEARRVDAIRSDFIANVSHELKTPVGAIALSAEILAEEDDPAVSRKLAGRIHQESSRLARVVEDLLDLSRLEAEHHPPREPTKLGVVMSEAVERVRASAEIKGVTVTTWESDPALAIMGDRRHLVTAAVNLLENAIAYSEPGTVVEIGAAVSGEGAALWVADEGIGIPEKDLDRVFERFYRVDRGRSRASGGTGLGLAIVRHVAQNHGATVDVVSREGEGSRFTINFPERIAAETLPLRDAS